MALPSTRIGAFQGQGMTFKDHFSSIAASYADFRPVYQPALADLLAERTPKHDLALDCGCGSGQLSLLLAEHFKKVIATDASAAQVAAATQHPKVTYKVAPAEDSGLPDQCADLVVAAQAAHWFDLPRFWREVDRVAKPGALAALVGYGLMSVDQAVDAIIVPYHNETLKPYWPAERWLVVAGYDHVKLPYKEVAAPPLAMTADWSLDQLVGYLTTWSGLKAAERAGQNLLPAVAERLAAVWGDPTSPRTVRWPLFLRLGRVGEPA
jgi:ubiquinone/menaquinone biosynthesis C-methylase UbiE